MKVEEFPENTKECNFTYFRVREGPNYFVSFYKNSSRLHYEPKECWRVLGVAKFTDSGKALKQWAVEMYESSLPKPELDIALLKAEGFGPEVHGDSEEIEPTDNTKKIT